MQNKALICALSSNKWPVC